MAESSRWRRRGVWLLSVAAMLQSGCALGRSNVSIDSNSRAPWMNLELLPSRKKKDTSSYHRSVNQRSGSSTEDAVEIEPAVAAPKKEVRLLNWLTPSSEKTPLPLPRTDVELSATGAAASTTKSTIPTETPDWWDF